MRSASPAWIAGVQDLEVRLDEPMSCHTSFGIGGPVDVLAIPHTAAALRHVLLRCRDENLPYLVIGNGTNIIFRDRGFRGAVIKVAGRMAEVTQEGTTLRAQAGAGLDRVCVQACDAGLAGLAWAAGIPGTMGGAVWMNAGANGGEIGQSVRHVIALDTAGNEIQLRQSDLEFSYRHSTLQGQALVVVEVELELAEGCTTELRREMYETIEKRCSKQPLRERSAGCIFKRPQDDFAGRLIDACGCKGLTIGGAQISSKHAGFIVNRGDATADDVLQLIDEVRRRVHENTGVWLEQEVCVVGEE